MIKSIGRIKQRLKNRILGGRKETLEVLLTRYSAEEVRDILVKRAEKKKKQDIEDLANYYLRCGDMDDARKILELYQLQKSVVYAKAVIAAGGHISDVIDFHLAQRGKLPKQIARILAKGIKNDKDKEKLQAVVLKGGSISEEKSIWRLRVIGQAARCAGDYTDSLAAYRKAFQHAKSTYADNLREKTPQSRLMNSLTKESFNSKLAWQALNDFSSLAAPGWFVDAGTLLGFVREGDFLKHDYDLDLGMVDPGAFHQTIENLTASPLFEVKPKRVYEVVKVKHANGVDLDIFLYQQVGDIMYKESHVYRWEFGLFEPEIRQFGEVTLPVPSNPEKHLEETYGDWWVQRKGFDGRYDANNVSFPNLDELECVLLNKAIIALQKGELETFEKETRMLQRIGRLL